MKIGRLRVFSRLASLMLRHRANAVNGEEPGRQEKEEHTMKNYMAVVVAVVLAAGMAIGTAGSVLADSEGAGVYGTTNSSEWTNPGSASGKAAVRTESGQARGPVGTGALHDGSVKADNGRWLNMDVSEQNRSPELRGRLNIQAGE
jgi:hypothetical protein